MVQRLSLNALPRTWGSTFDGQADLLPAVTRKEALAALARVASILNLQRDDVVLTHVLMSLAGSAWKKGRRPEFEAVSLYDISRETGFDFHEIDRRLVSLKNAGILNLASDQHAKDQGILVDLAPLASRTAQFEWMAQADEFSCENSLTDDLANKEPDQAGFFDNFDFSERNLNSFDFGTYFSQLFSPCHSTDRKSGRISNMLTSFFGFWTGTNGLTNETSNFNAATDQPDGEIEFAETDHHADVLADGSVSQEVNTTHCQTVDLSTCDQPDCCFEFAENSKEMDGEDTSQHCERLAAHINLTANDRDDMAGWSIAFTPPAPARHKLSVDAAFSKMTNLRSYKPTQAGHRRKTIGHSIGNVAQLTLSSNSRIPRNLMMAFRDLEIQLHL